VIGGVSDAGWNGCGGEVENVGARLGYRECHNAGDHDRILAEDDVERVVVIEVGLREQNGPARGWCDAVVRERRASEDEEWLQSHGHDEQHQGATETGFSSHGAHFNPARVFRIRNSSPLSFRRQIDRSP